MGDQANLKHRIQALNRELNFPSAQRLQRALAKEGVPARVKDIEELFTLKEARERQVLQPPHKYEGNIASARLE